MIRRIGYGIVFIALCSFLVACGGGGGGGSSSTLPVQTPTPADAIRNFTGALRTNNEAAAASVFAEATKDKSMRIWQSLSAAEKNFISRAIEDSVAVPTVSDDLTYLDLFITVKDAGGEIERIPLILVKDGNGNWKIQTW